MFPLLKVLCKSEAKIVLSRILLYDLKRKYYESYEQASMPYVLLF